MAGLTVSSGVSRRNRSGHEFEYLVFFYSVQIIYDLFVRVRNNIFCRQIKKRLIDNSIGKII